MTILLVALYALNGVSQRAKIENQLSNGAFVEGSVIFSERMV